MSIIVQHRRDSRANCEANTPAAGEAWFDTTLKALRWGDGGTLGGFLQKLWGRSYKLAPAQITADQNDYNPADLAIAEHINLTSDAARTITGLAGGSINRTLSIRNKGTFNITLSHQNGASAGANRFDFGGDDVALRPGDATHLHYDEVASRWGKGAGNTKVSRIPEELLLSGSIAPAQITASLNDYAPAGITLASALRLSTDASRSITGLVDPRDGVVKTIVNVGANPIVLKNADVGSAAANRFDFGADVTMAAKQSAVLRYDGTDARWKLLAATAGAAVAAGAVTAQTLAASGLPPAVGFNNVKLVESHAANAVTFAVKTLAGTDPTAADPANFVFRDALVNGGVAVKRDVTGALSVTVSAGSSLGVGNSVALKAWLVAIDNLGTVELAVINCFNGSDIFPLGQLPICSTTAEGGAGAADNAHVFYSATARASVPYVVLGYFSYESGLAAAGTWVASPTRIQQFGHGVPLPGQVVQEKFSQTGTAATGSTTYTYSDTIPTTANGDQYMSLAITPTSATNLLEVEAVAQLAASATGQGVMALHQDAIGAAVSTSFVDFDADAPARDNAARIRHRLLAGTTSATTFKTRAGNTGASTVTFNGSAGARAFGGTLNSFMGIKEIMT